MRNRTTIAAAGVILSLAVALGGCGGCKSKSEERSTGTASFFPARPRSIVLVPDAARLGAIVKELEQTKLAGLVASAAGAKGTAELIRPVVRQLGFDPRSPEGFAKAGIDGNRGLAFGDDGTGKELLVIAVGDADRFDDYVGTLARRFGGQSRGEQRWEGTPEAPAPARTIVTFADTSGRVRLAYGSRDGYAVIGSGEGAVEAVGLALSRKAEQRLDSSAAFARMSRKIGERDVVAWLPEGMGEGKRRRFEGGLAVGVTMSAGGVNTRFLMPRGPLEVAMIRPLGKVAGAELLERLPADGFLAVRLGGEPISLQPLLGSILPRGLASSLRKAGINPVGDVLATLQPGIVLGVSLNPEIDLSGGLPTDPSISRTNPFRFVNAVILAKVKDPAKATEVLERFAANAKAFKMEIESEATPAGTVYRATYAAGEGMSWSLIGDTLVAAGGKDAFEAARTRVLSGAVEAGGGTAAETERKPAMHAGAGERGQVAAADAGRVGAAGKVRPGAELAEAKAFTIDEPSARKIFESAGSAAHLDVPRLASSLRTIPPSAFGVGGFRLQALLESWVALLDEVKGITASLSIDESGMIVDAELGLK